MADHGLGEGSVLYWMKTRGWQRLENRGGKGCPDAPPEFNEEGEF